MRPRRHLLCVAVGMLVCLAPAAHAYVLPAESLLRLLADSRREGSLRDATLQLSADLAERDHPVDEHLYLKRPERARLVRQDETTWVAIDREGQAASGDEKAIRAQATPSTHLLPILLLPRGKDLDEMQGRLARALQAVGVDTGVVTLARIGDTVVTIIGAHVWETDRPQVWLEKATLLPVRYRMPGKVGDKPGMLETRLLEYGTGPVPSLPRIIEDYENGALVRHAEVISAQVNQDLPETLFEWGPRRR